MIKFKLKQGGMAVLIGLCVLIFSQTVYGFDIMYEGGQSSVTVIGESKIKKAGQIVTLRLDNSEGTPLFAWQTETNAAGEYTFDMYPNYFGDATIAVSVDGNVVSKPFYSSTDTEVQDALQRFGKDETAENIIADEAKILMVDTEEFELLNEDGIFADYLETQSYTKPEDFKKAYQIGGFLATVRLTLKEDSGDILSKEKKCTYINEIETGELGSIYSKSTDSDKILVLSHIAGNNFGSLEAYIEARNEYTVFNMIQKASNYNEKYSIAKKYNKFGLDFDKFEALEDKLEDFKEEWFNLPASNIEALAANAQIAYEAVSNDDKGKNVATSNGKHKDVTISGTYTPDVPKVIGTIFADLEDCEWARTAVTLLASRGVVNGKSEGVFAPMDSVTRAEFVKMLAGAFALSGTTEKTFDDVVESHWAYSYVSAAVANGIAKGVSETSFGASDKITRQDMAVLCARLAEARGIVLSYEQTFFVDGDTIADYAIDSVCKLAGAGIITGIGNDEFAPYNTATRAEAAVMIYRLYEYVAGR